MRARFHNTFLVIGLVTSMAMAQTQSAKKYDGLAGAVQDTSGAVIVSAKVALLGQDGTTIVTQGVTDNSGNFKFTNVSTGDYTLDVTQTGFREVKQAIKVGLGRSRRCGSCCQSHL